MEKIETANKFSPCGSCLYSSSSHPDFFPVQVAVLLAFLASVGHQEGRLFTICQCGTLPSRHLGLDRVA